MNSVIKGASYVLVHTPDMVLYNGTTQTTERVVNPDSEYLKAVPEHLRSYEEAVSYWPNQTYIGNAHPDELAEIEFPYYDKKKEGAERYGKYGEIMPEEEFLLLVQACDMFEVVRLDKAFVEKYKETFAKDPVISDDIVEKIHEGVELSEIETLISEDHAEPLYFEHQLVGCVKPAHDIDVNLSSHVMHENLMSKASSVLALLYAVKNAGIEKSDVEYVIDCAEEACGDMNQRGGGNFAKAAAEIGMDGLILPDVPFEEKEEFAIPFKEHGLDLISLIAPTSHERIAMIAKEAEGFGISEPKQAEKTAAQSDGVIVGSTIVKLCEKYGADCVPHISTFVKEMKDAIR